MPSSQLNKKGRQNELVAFLNEHPFSTDEELAQRFGVSIQTIRLDRISLRIPELRERMKRVAEKAQAQVKAIDVGELIGELLHIELGVMGLSLLRITEEMLLQKTKIARGQHLFAQANSLAVAVIDAKVALTGSARVRFRRPVLLNEKVICKATVKLNKANTYLVSVQSTVEGELVFKGHFFIVVAQKD